MSISSFDFFFTRIFLDQPSQPGHVKTTFISLNFKLELSKE